MSTITATTTYPDGAALNIAGHNENVYSTTAGKGVMSEPNGGLDKVNLVGGFTLRDEHVMSEEGVFTRQDSSTFAFDLYNNVFGHREDAEKTYVTLGGLSHRLYIPFDVSAVVWQWSFFLAPWRPYITQTFDQVTGTQSIPDLYLRVFVDGVDKTPFFRAVAVSADVQIQPSAYGGTAGGKVNYEDVAAMWYDISKLETSVTKGFHELSVRVYMPRIHHEDSDDESLVAANETTWGNPDGDSSTTIYATLHDRITLGTRSIRAIVFK